MKINSVLKAIAGSEDLEEVKTILALLGAEFEDMSDDSKTRLIVKCDDGKLKIGKKKLAEITGNAGFKSHAIEAGIC